jgi:hypothetical protein
MTMRARDICLWPNIRPRRINGSFLFRAGVTASIPIKTPSCLWNTPWTQRISLLILGRLITLSQRPSRTRASATSHPPALNSWCNSQVVTLPQQISSQRPSILSATIVCTTYKPWCSLSTLSTSSLGNLGSKMPTPPSIGRPIQSTSTANSSLKPSSFRCFRTRPCLRTQSAKSVKNSRTYSRLNSQRSYRPIEGDHTGSIWFPDSRFLAHGPSSCHPLNQRSFKNNSIDSSALASFARRLHPSVPPCSLRTSLVVVSA